MYLFDEREVLETEINELPGVNDLLPELVPARAQRDQLLLNVWRRRVLALEHRIARAHERLDPLLKQLFTETNTLTKAFLIYLYPLSNIHAAANK